MADSQIVYIRTDTQANIPIKAVDLGDGTYALRVETELSGTGGIATEAKQDTGNTSLSSVDGKLPSTLGEKTQALSLSVALARNLPTLAQRHFTGKAGTAVMTGYFVDVNNLKVGSPFSASITTAAVFDFANAEFDNASAIPAGAVDVVFDLITNDIHFECVSGAATLTTGNKATYPTLVAGLNMRANDVML